MSQVLHFICMRSVNQKLMLLRGVLSSGNCQFSLQEISPTVAERTGKGLLVWPLEWGRNASVSFHRWWRVAVTIYNPLPRVQELFPIPCSVLFYSLLRHALAMWGTCPSKNKTLATAGISVAHTHTQCGNCLWKHFQWRALSREKDGHLCCHPGESYHWGVTSYLDTKTHSPASDVLWSLVNPAGRPSPCSVWEHIWRSKRVI